MRTVLALMSLAFLPMAVAAADADPGSGAAAAIADPCAGSTRCYNAGTFTAEVVSLSSTAMRPGVRHQSIALNIRFRNISHRPVILGYKSASSSAIDNFGNQFYWGRAGTHDSSVKGMGHVSARAADTQFALAPGQSRNATFNLVRYGARPPIGTAWSYDVVIDELEILPGQQVRTVRENSVNFQNLTAGGFASNVAGAPAATSASGDAPATPADVATQVLSLFDKLTKK